MKRIGLAALVATAMTTCQVSAQDAKVEFEITFLANNFSAIRLPKLMEIKAGDILSSQGYNLLNSLENCMSDWSSRYTRSDAAFSLTSKNIARSGEIEAEVSSFFELNGQVSVSMNSKIGDDGTLDVEADNVRIERFFAEDIIDTADTRCQSYVDLYSNGYASGNYTTVERAIFLGGDMTHSYVLSLSGSGSGSIGSDKLASFFERVPLLSGLKDIFSMQAELSVGRESVESETTRFGYGDSNSIFAVGFLPVSIQETSATDLISRINELPNGSASLIDASRDAESANSFLQEYPEFDVSNAESILVRMFSGDGLTFYDKFRDGNPVAASQFAELFSRILEINRAAGREF